MTPYSMTDYLLGQPGRIHRLITQETCQTQYDTDRRRAWFVKNGNSEEIAVHSDFIWRGTDTSPNAAEYYQLWEKGRLGSRWCPAIWGVGQPFRREAEVRYFLKSDGRPSKPVYTDVTWLEIMAQHPTKTFPSGITLEDVLEVAWYANPAQKLERYWYARGWGLVGFSRDEQMQAYVVALDGIAPVRQTWPGIVPMPLPAPTLPGKEDPMWRPYTLISPSGQNLRSNTKLSGEFVGKILGLIPNGAKIKVITDPGLVYIDDENNYTWYGVWWLDTDQIGWVALRTGAQFEDQFRADTPPPVEEPPEPPAAPPTDREYARKLIDIHTRQAEAYAALAQAERDFVSLIQSILERTQSA